MSFKLVSWTPLTSGTMRGFATVEMSSGMILHDCPVFRGNDGWWASPSSKPQMNRDGLVLDAAGKPKYAQVVTFKSKEVRNRWSEAVIATLRAARPGEFD